MERRDVVSVGVVPGDEVGYFCDGDPAKVGKSDGHALVL